MVRFESIPQEKLDDIASLMFDNVGCSEVLKPILEEHYGEPWTDGEFFICDLAEEKSLVEKIYHEMFKEDGNDL